jgi:hypothetical protein
MSKWFLGLCASVSCVFFGLAPATAAPRAQYVTPESLPGEGLPHVLDVTALAAYARVLDPARVSGLENMGIFAVRARAQLGRSATYCVGLDGEIGGGETGAVYGATAYPVGLGARWGAGNTVSLCGGAGLDGIAGAVPLAARFPAEASVALSLGPIRPVLWVRPSWLAAPASRRSGSSVSFLDELEAGLMIRLSPQHRYWTQTSAGGGLAVGVLYRELMATRYVAFAVGFDFVGAQ